MDELIQKLLKQQLYLGTSSWKYEGWKGLVYRKPYKSLKEFNETCLGEYSEHYSTVGVDHTYYAWPSAKGFKKYVAETPDRFRFGLKATEKVTVFKYPNHPRYGKEAGLLNPGFLDAQLFQERFLEPLSPFKDRIGPIMFEFSQFYKGTVESGGEFVERLAKFFDKLPTQEFQFAVEIRNANWLHKAYFECLTEHRVGHVFNSWTRMPLLGEQASLSEKFALPVIVSRLLLNPGRIYKEAVEEFAPYDKLQLELHDIRESLVGLLLRAKAMGVPAYVFVNNRFEGCAPKTIEGLLDLYIKKGSNEG